MNSFNHARYDFLFLATNRVGDGLMYISLIISFLFVRYRWAVISLACFLSTSLTVQLLKRTVFSEALRPTAFFDETVTLNLVAGVTQHSYRSFPSGHTASAFSLMLVLLLFINNKKWGVVFALLALFAGYSRVYLSQHFFEDIYAGSILGMLITIITYYYIDQRLRNTSWAAQHLPFFTRKR